MPDTNTQQYVLGARPPVRALLIGSVTTLVGAIVVVASHAAWRSTAGTTIGAIALILGLALSLAAWLAWRRLRAVVVLDRTGVTVLRGRQRTGLAWPEIGEVRLTGPRLTLVPKDGGGGIDLVNPAEPTDPTFIALLAALRAGLDADRGYHNLL